MVQQAQKRKALTGRPAMLKKSLSKRLRGPYRTTRQLWRAAKSQREGQYLADNLAIFWAGKDRQRRIGIYMKGSCDLPSVFSTIPEIRRSLNGRCCMVRRGLVSDSRSDLLLQTLKKLPAEQTAPVIEKLHLRRDYFQPQLFDPTFSVRGPWGTEQFPKRVVMLSVAADTVRTVYRHRESGILVDPGGYWLNSSMKKVLGDLETASWVQKNFESIGRIKIEDFVANFSQIVRLVKQNTGAQVMVFNVLTVEPGTQTHNYQFVRDPHSMRRREFDGALVEMSRQLDFSIVDVDRVLKRTGILETQVDFAHFPSHAYEPIGREILKIFRDREILPTV